MNYHISNILQDYIFLKSLSNWTEMLKNQVRDYDFSAGHILSKCESWGY